MSKPNDTPYTVKRKQHTHAWAHPYPGFEQSIASLTNGLVGYAAVYLARYTVPISRDPILGDEWLKIAQGIVILLDGDTGRFHCPTIDGLIRATAEGAGFTLQLERRPGDPLADDSELAQDD